MEKKYIKIFLISSLICLLPMAIGGIMWNILPDEAMRQISGTQQGPWWTKGFVVIGIPVLFLLAHLYGCLIRPKRARPVSKKIMFWVNPVISNLCFVIFAVLSFVWRV